MLSRFFSWSNWNWVYLCISLFVALGLFVCGLVLF